MQDEKYRVGIEERDDEIRSLRDQLCRCGDSPRWPGTMRLGRDYDRRRWRWVEPNATG